VAGREFTVGLLGDKRPRVLPAMEILFLDKNNPRPVYDYQIKQEWEKHVYYQCPAHLSAGEVKAIGRVARDTFEALDCRDVARVDLRMDEGGNFYVLEVNPLPGLTPEYSDLCLIAKAANIDYRSLIGEILSGGLKRLREKRRAEAREAEAARVVPGANGNGEGNGKGDGNGKGERATSEKTPAAVPETP
jgi:D-alanine-D-alanine ligase